LSDMEVNLRLYLRLRSRTSVPWAASGSGRTTEIAERVPVWNAEEPRFRTEMMRADASTIL